MPGDDMASNHAVAGLILAAGFSRRFGSDKRQARLSNIQTLLAASLSLPCAQLPEVWVVLRPEDDAQALDIPAGVHTVRTEAVGQGMGDSLARGIRAISQQTSADAVAVFLGDMPWITTRSLHSLRVLATAENIVLPTYQGQSGHPVIFGRRFWPQLQQLTGEAGAKALVKEHDQAVHRFETNDAGVLRDVDTPASMNEGP